MLIIIYVLHVRVHEFDLYNTRKTRRINKQCFSELRSTLIFFTIL